MISFLQPLLRRSAGPFTLVNARSGAVIADQLIAAFDSASRRTGLLKHGSLPARSAMIIAPSNAIHTFFMKFPIDVVFVARDGQVRKVRHAVAPWRMSGCLRAYAVIELPAGTAREAGVDVGDRLEIRPHTSS